MITFEYRHKGGLTFAENRVEPFILECMQKEQGYYVVSSISLFYALKSLILEEKVAPYAVQMLYLGKSIPLVHDDNWHKPAHFLERAWSYHRSINNEDKVLCVPIIAEEKIRQDIKRDKPDIKSNMLHVHYDIEMDNPLADGEIYTRLKQRVFQFHAQTKDLHVKVGDELAIYALRALVAKNYIHHHNVQIHMPYSFTNKLGESGSGVEIFKINADANLSHKLNDKRDGIRHGDNIHYLQNDEQLMQKLQRQLKLAQLQDKLSDELPDNSANEPKSAGHKIKI